MIRSSLVVSWVVSRVAACSCPWACAWAAEGEVWLVRLEIWGGSSSFLLLAELLGAVVSDGVAEMISKSSVGLEAMIGCLSGAEVYPALWLTAA